MEHKVRTRNEYLALRRRYHPQTVKLILVTESPPYSGKYFYDPTGEPSEPLFTALMKQIGVEPSTKAEGLDAFKRSGWVLVDATYEPVNDPSKTQRDKIIGRDYPLLVADIRELTHGAPVPLVLIKANVCRLLEQRLKGDGFNVLNRGLEIYFPSSGQQGRFYTQFRQVLSLHAPLQ